jgi:hypothetical protein
MPKYEITLRQPAYATVVVEAESVDDLIAKALKIDADCLPWKGYEAFTINDAEEIAEGENITVHHIEEKANRFLRENPGYQDQ